MKKVKPWHGWAACDPKGHIYPVLWDNADGARRSAARLHKIREAYRVTYPTSRAWMVARKAGWTIERITIKRRRL